jgi:arsenate reductase
MAEAILNRIGGGCFKAYSAGSRPAGSVNPFTIQLLREQGHPVDGLTSKSWSVFERPDAPHMDMIITVCDNAAGEACPVWPGQPVTAHWGFEDPAAFTGPDEAKRAKFHDIYRQIMTRVRLLVSLPAERLDHLALETELRSIGKRRDDVRA